MGIFSAIGEFQDERRRSAGVYTPEETAQAWRELNNRLNEGFQSQALSAATDAAEKNPGSEINIIDYQVSPLERWRQQVDALVESDNPILRKQGMDMMASYHQKATTPTSGETTPNSWREFMLSTNPEDRTPEAYRKFLLDNRSASAVNVNLGAQKEGMPLSLEEKEMYNLPGDQTYVHTKTGPKPLKQYGFTEAEWKTAQFASQMDHSSQILNGLEGEGFRATEVVDKLGEILPVGSSYVLSPAQQVWLNAAQQWVRAKLRRESGAVIGDDEMSKEIQTFFAQPGDSESTIRSKAYARKVAEDALRMGAGGSYEKKLFESLEELIESTKKETRSWYRGRNAKLPAYLVSEYDNADFGEQ